MENLNRTKDRNYKRSTCRTQQKQSLDESNSRLWTNKSKEFLRSKISNASTSAMTHLRKTMLKANSINYHNNMRGSFNIKNNVNTQDIQPDGRASMLYKGLSGTYHQNDQQTEDQQNQIYEVTAIANNANKRNTFNQRQKLNNNKINNKYNKNLHIGKYINLRTFSRNKFKRNAHAPIGSTLDKKMQKLSIHNNSICPTSNSHSLQSTNAHKMGQLPIDNQTNSSLNTPSKQLYDQLNSQIDHVFRHLEVLKQYGFTQKKITKWMNIFLARKSQSLRDIFLKAYLNKKSLSNSMVYERWINIDTSIAKMDAITQRMTQSEKIFLLSEIRCFKSYIEQIVIKKAQSNLDQIFNIGTINPILKFNKVSQLGTSSEIFHFIKDLKSIEDRYGQLSIVSKVNRVMFKQILAAQDKFVNEFYNSNNEQ